MELHADEIDSDTCSSAATSRLKILTAAYEIPSVSKLERTNFRCIEHEMPKHEELYDSKDCQDRCDQVATRGMDFPDGHARVAARRPAPAAVRQ